MNAVMERRVSPAGRKFIYDHEGVVLKAYRDAVGVWTIGAGLTAASGVIKPKAGMQISAAENDRLVDLALTRNYIPRVIKALGTSVSQHALDGGTSFDFNTGAINRASWVKSFLAGKSEEARQRLGLWKKGDGKVLPGLVRRRKEEADLILLARYPAAISTAPSPANDTAYAVFVVRVSASEIEDISQGFSDVGYYPGGVAGLIRKSAVEDFQRAYDLTVDGKIGRATLSTLQRELDARRKTQNAALTTATGVTATTGAGAAVEITGSALSLDPATIPTGTMYATSGLVLVAAVVYGGYLAWQYRDMIAVRVAGKAPRLAAWLRSF